MASVQALEIRPRTTGEILDDAWRLYLADAPRLLLLHGLLHIPAFSFLLILVAVSPPSFVLLNILMLLTAALLLAATGLSSAAVQERLRRLADGRDASMLHCLGAALRRGLEHTALRSILLPLWLLGPLSLPVWPVAATLPSIFADTNGFLPSLGRIGQEARFDPGKASAVVFCRLPILLMAFLNAHWLIQAVVWAAGSLAGFDVALLEFQCSLSDKVYVLALFLGCWLLLAPFFEVSNYLLYLDTRTRQEGLDLLYRVQRAFSGVDPKRAAGLVALVVGWLIGIPVLSAQAPQTERVAAVRQVREAVEMLRQQVKDAKPYNDGATIERQLRELGETLKDAWPEGTEPFPWYWKTIDHFKDKNQGDALLALDELQQRLAQLEETLKQPAPATNNNEPPLSKDDIKKLLRNPNELPPANEPKKKQDEKKDDLEPKRPVIKKNGPGNNGPAVDDGTPNVTVQPPALGNTCWLVFAGLVLAVVVVGLVLFLVNRPWGKKTPQVQTGRSEAATEETLEQLHQQPVAELLRRADDLARQEQYLEALRAAFLATLSLLHRKQLLRYEPTRTNGEYVREVRLAPQAPQALHEPFNRLTVFFEVKWYGERNCDARDYNNAREFVTTIQGIVGVR